MSFWPGKPTALSWVHRTKGDVEVVAKRRQRLVLSLLTLLLTLAAAAEPVPNLRPGHPRLLVLDEQVASAKQAIATDRWAMEAFKLVQARGDKLLSDRTARYELVGPRLLGESRRALQTITTTAGLYRLTGDARYAERARREMLAVAAFGDWHPPHFLDAAEMTNAVAIGYDWIFNTLSPQDRATIETAIVEKGLKAGLADYAKGVFWTRASHNWAQVCAGGLTIGALAVADKEPDLARKVIDLARQTMVAPMAQFTPDGGWDEGPGYWSYATRYNVYYLAALETALGTDFGFFKQPGFAQAGLFRIQTTGPTLKTFNFADAHDEVGTSSQMFWLASHFNQPAYAAWERAISAKAPDIFHLMWFIGSDKPGTRPGLRTSSDTGATAAEALPLDAVFRRIDVACFRGAWGDADTWFVGFKGGDNGANHSHLDLGTFVLDALGQRWAIDFGGDDYDLAGYFGKDRFTYYRLPTEGHNTLTINSENQATKAKAPLVGYFTSANRASAIADLTSAYAGTGATSIWRGVCLLDRRRVLVQDEIELSKSAEVVWNFHTPATVQIDPDGIAATLKLDDKQLRARILWPTGARFDVIAANPPPPQRQNPGVSNLIIRVGGVAGAQRIAVLFCTIDDTAEAPIDPLSIWPHD